MDYKLGDKAEFERFFGVYETFDLVPTLGVNPFDTKEWVETNQPRILQLKRASEEKGIPESYFFPVIAVAESKIREKGNVKIVDIGGGYGENYLNIIRCLKTAGIEYHVIEQEKNCEAGRELSISGNILFHENVCVGGGRTA
ncbi:MAG: hypothetical protein K2K90_13260 [Lachnospiraceae bacterium]|nr:hypothetical protein [Lachnospiraceae bacterium]